MASDTTAVMEFKLLCQETSSYMQGFKFDRSRGTPLQAFTALWSSENVIRGDSKMRSSFLKGAAVTAAIAVTTATGVLSGGLLMAIPAGIATVALGKNWGANDNDKKLMREQFPVFQSLVNEVAKTAKDVVRQTNIAFQQRQIDSTERERVIQGIQHHLDEFMVSTLSNGVGKVRDKKTLDQMSRSDWGKDFKAIRICLEAIDECERTLRNPPTLRPLGTTTNQHGIDRGFQPGISITPDKPQGPEFDR